jgi:hypothetical protein
MQTLFSFVQRRPQFVIVTEVALNFIRFPSFT